MRDLIKLVVSEVYKFVKIIKLIRFIRNIYARKADAEIGRKLTLSFIYFKSNATIMHSKQILIIWNVEQLKLECLFNCAALM